MEIVKLGIIGAGYIAKQHLEVLKGIEWMKAVGITSRTKAKAEGLAREYSIPVCVEDIKSLIIEAKPDALMILVSAEQIYNVVSAVMPFGLPLFIEKPAGLTPQANEDLVQQAKNYSLKTMVGFNRRFYSIFHKGIKIIKDYGPLLGVFVEGHERIWQKHGDVKFSDEMLSKWIYVNGVHTIDLLRFFGGEPKGIKAIARSYKEPSGDQFAAIMEFDSHAIGEYSAHWYSPGGWRVVLYGDGVTVEFKPLEKGSWMGKDFVVHEIEPDEEDIKFKPGFYRQMEAFGRLVRDGIQEWPALDLAGAYKTMRLTEEISHASLHA